VLEISPPPGFDPRTVQPVASHPEVKRPLKDPDIDEIIHSFCSEYFNIMVSSMSKDPDIDEIIILKRIFKK
jgi:hypothetical protein